MESFGEEEIREILKDWGAPWLMTFDEYNDASGLTTSEIQQYMPRCDRGHFLITSRLDRNYFRNLCEEDSIIEVEDWTTTRQQTFSGAEKVM